MIFRSALFSLAIAGLVGCSQQPNVESHQNQTGVWAVAKTKADACRQMRESGELANYVAAADCSNEIYTAELEAAGFPYMDLVAKYASRRREIASQLDNGEITLEEAHVRLRDGRADLNVEIQRRDNLEERQEIIRSQHEVAEEGRRALWGDWVNRGY